MSSTIAARPASSEYASYYDRYVSKVPQGDILTLLKQQKSETLKLLAGIPEERGAYRYAEGKWSIKEVLGHIIDAERIFAYRALRFGRGDTSELPGFEQDDYVKYAGSDSRTLADLTTEYQHVRDSTISLVASFDEAAFSRTGVASQNPITVRALLYVIAGHELHHLAVLKERYL